MGVLAGKIGEGVVRYWPPPNELVLSVGGSYVCANFCENRSRNATVRVLADEQTDTQTQIDFIICPMLYAIAMGQIMSLCVCVHVCVCVCERVCVCVCEWVSKFWDPLHISRTVVTRNFKFGTRIGRWGY